MRTFTKIFSVLLVVAVILGVLSFVYDAGGKKDAQMLSDTFLRLHIRANSDSKEDQALKLLVRDSVLSYTSPLLSDAENKQDAIQIISENKSEITDVAKTAILKNGYDYEVSVSVEREHFDYREYDGFFLPEGDYDALIVNIGSGKGHNWWCVVYPAVCLSGATGEIQTDTEKVPVRFRLPQKAVAGKVKYEFWIVKVIRSLFEK